MYKKGINLQINIGCLHSSGPNWPVGNVTISTSTATIRIITLDFSLLLQPCVFSCSEIYWSTASLLALFELLKLGTLDFCRRQIRQF